MTVDLELRAMFPEDYIEMSVSTPLVKMCGTFDPLLESMRDWTG